MNTFDLRLDLDKGLTPGQVVRIRQGDTDGTTIRATIYDHGTALSGTVTACAIVMKLPDGTHYYRKGASWADGTATVTIDERQAASVVGRTVLAYFTVTVGTVQYSTGAFAVIVEPDAVGDAELPEDYDTAIQDAIDRCNAAAAALEGALPIDTANIANGAVTADKLADAVRKGNVRSFDTVAEMQAATYLEDGMTCHTNGFHSAGDGGAAYYTVSASGTANGMDVLALQNSLYATLVVTEPYVTPEQFGAWGDDTHDDADAINRALALSDCVMLGAKIYLVGSTISLASDQTIKGCNKFDSIIKGASSLVGAPVVSGSVTSYGPTTATSNTHISLCDMGIAYYGGRTQPAILFINCEFTLLDNIYAYCYGGTVDNHCGIWMIRSTSTIDGNTWANRIQNSRLHSTSIYLSENTDCYIHDNDINCMNNPYAIRLETADGLSLRGNQIINKVYCGRNVGVSICGNYFDGYYKHDVDTHLIGIEICGPFFNAIIESNRFYELPYEAIIVHGTNAYMQSTTISHNTFENCDIFANGLSDIIVEYTRTLNAGINMCGNIHRRTEYVTLSEGIATRHIRYTSSGETKAMPVNVTHGGTVTVRWSLCPTMVACSAYSGLSGYIAQDYTTGLKSLLCYPELIFANTSS